MKKAVNFSIPLFSMACERDYAKYAKSEMECLQKNRSINWSLGFMAI